MTETQTYTVPDTHCGHCKAAVTRDLEAVTGVESVEVDLESKRVRITGQDFDDASLRAAITKRVTRSPLDDEHSPKPVRREPLRVREPAGRS